jgi:hypothetical protein
MTQNTVHLHEGNNLLLQLGKLLHLFTETFAVHFVLLNCSADRQGITEGINAKLNEMEGHETIKIYTTRF